MVCSCTKLANQFLCVRVSAFWRREGGGRRVIQEIPTRSFSYASYDSHFVRRRIKLIYSSAEQCAWPVDMICVHTYTCIYVYIYMRNVLYILLHYHDVLPYDFRYYIMCDILTAHTRLNHARDINFSQHQQYCSRNTRIYTCACTCHLT